MEELIFKVVRRDEWEACRKSGVFHGAQIDLDDGYIHFSTSKQVEETLAKHFAGQDDLYMIAIDANMLSEKLKWEASRGGDLFPHLYEPLTFDTVVWESELSIGDDDVHQLPNQFEVRDSG